MRRALLLAVALLGCGGRAEDADPFPGASPCSPDSCGWSIVGVVSVPVVCWNVESGDVNVARLRADGRACLGEDANGCVLTGCEHIDGIAADETVEIWSPPGVDGDDALALTSTSPCE